MSDEPHHRVADVRPAQRTDIAALSRVLGRAFYDDPITMWMLPDAGSRSARMARYFATLARHQHLAAGGIEVACSGSEIVAATLWSPPGRWKVSWRTQLAMLPGYLRALGVRLRAEHVIGRLMTAAHPDVPHWYLADIGSDPSVRGRGFAQALMRSRLDRCDAERWPAYLESGRFENIAYYQRFGFEVTGEIALPGGGPSMWPMWREPA